MCIIIIWLEYLKLWWNRPIGLGVFTNVPGDWGSILGRVIPKTEKMILDTSFLNTQHYKKRFKEKLSNPGKGVAPSPTPRCSSYWKGSFWVALNYGHQLILFCVCVCVCVCVHINKYTFVVWRNFLTLWIWTAIASIFRQSKLEDKL